MLTFTPLAPWIYPTADWDQSDARAYWRARKTDRITDRMADRLLTRYASLQLEIIHPDYRP